MANMETVRIDKWLWAARFFKTRSLAAQAVGGGHVALNGNKVKPARLVNAGDMLVVRQGFDERTVRIVALSEHRGPAAVAQLLYEETEELLAKRTQAQELRRVMKLQEAKPEHRPDKHARRKIRQFLKKE